MGLKIKIPTVYSLKLHSFVLHVKVNLFCNSTALCTNTVHMVTTNIFKYLQKSPVALDKTCLGYHTVNFGKNEQVFCCRLNYELSISLLHVVKLLLRPSSSQSPVGLGDTKETSFCNVTEDISISDPRKGLCSFLCLVIFGVKHLVHCFMN